MKIVHIATYVNGGAGTAAYRIHEAMLKENIDSHFLCRDEPIDSAAKKVVQCKKPVYNAPQRAWRKMKRWAADKIDLGKINYQYRLRNRLAKIRGSLSSEFTGLPFSDYDILSHPLVKNADIIHLHWVADFLDYPSFFKKNKKPVVWTFHDMNPVMGLFHYEADQIRNAAVSQKLDEEVKEIKRKYIDRSKASMSAVAPSLWLQEKSNNSKVFQTSPVGHIPYALNTDVFYFRNTEVLRRELKIPSENTIFLFVSQSVTNFRKGFDLLMEALQQMETPLITLLIIGYSEKLDLPALHCINLGSIYDNELLSHYYSLADAFILPSREDNLPNVMLESLACGTPVISFDTGGMSSIVQNGFTGLNPTEITSSSLKNTLEIFLERKKEFSRQKIRDYALEHFNENKIATEYIQLYKNLIGK